MLFWLLFQGRIEGSFLEVLTRTGPYQFEAYISDDRNLQNYSTTQFIVTLASYYVNHKEWRSLHHGYCSIWSEGPDLFKFDPITYSLERCHQTFDWTRCRASYHLRKYPSHIRGRRLRESSTCRLASQSHFFLFKREKHQEITYPLRQLVTAAETPTIYEKANLFSTLTYFTAEPHRTHYGIDSLVTHRLTNFWYGKRGKGTLRFQRKQAAGKGNSTYWILSISITKGQTHSISITFQEEEAWNISSWTDDIH